MVGHLSRDSSHSGLGGPPVVRRFDAGRLAGVRREVDAAARELGLDPDKAVDFVAAVNEVMTNAIRHGGGSGELRLWRDDRLTCEVRDTGPGFPADRYLHRSHRPVPSARGGMGLWIAQQTSDAISIDSGPAGTTVRLSVHLPAAAP